MEKELEAFLQDHSQPFVAWLTDELKSMRGFSKSEIEKDVAIASKSSGSKVKARSRSPRKQRETPSAEQPHTKKVATRAASAGVAAKRRGNAATNLFGRAVQGIGRADRREQRPSKEANSIQPPKLVPRAAESPPRAQARKRRETDTAQRPSRDEESASEDSEEPPPKRISTPVRDDGRLFEKAILQKSPGVRSRAAAVSAAISAAARSTQGSPVPPRRGASPFRAPPPRPLRIIPHAPPPRGGLPPPSPCRRHESSSAEPPVAVLTPASASSTAKPVETVDANEASRWHFQAFAGHLPLHHAAAVQHVPPVSASAPALHPLQHPGVPQHPLMPYGVFSPSPGHPGPCGMLPPGHGGWVVAPPPPTPPPQLPAQQVVVSVPGKSAPPRPRNFVPQKWRVCRENTVVRQTEHLESPEVRVLREGEIVESVGPPFTLPAGVHGAGVVRLEIAHPSSAAYPNPIGWVTQDATAAGGPRYLEPGPQPVTSNIRPVRPSHGGWRPRASSQRPYRPRAASFTNISWRPTS
jgi:hypothetical protein